MKELSMPTETTANDAGKIREVFLEAFRLSRSPYCNRHWLTTLMGRHRWPQDDIEMFVDTIMAHRSAKDER